jgi:hypothetical protein
MSRNANSVRGDVESQAKGGPKMYTEPGGERQAVRDMIDLEKWKLDVFHQHIVFPEITGDTHLDRANMLSLNVAAQIKGGIADEAIEKLGDSASLMFVRPPSTPSA